MAEGSSCVAPVFFSPAKTVELKQYQSTNTLTQRLTHQQENKNIRLHQIQQVQVQMTTLDLMKPHHSFKTLENNECRFLKKY